MKIARCVLRSTGLLWVGLACAPAFAVGSGSPSPAGAEHPSHRSARVPKDGAYGESGERRSGRAHSLTIQRGVLTVDGMTVRTGLSFRITDMRYMYVYVPGAGTTVISERPFGGALEEKAAFRGRTLTVNAGGSRLQLTAANKMRGSHSAFVRFDRRRRGWREHADGGLWQRGAGACCMGSGRRTAVDRTAESERARTARANRQAVPAFGAWSGEVRADP